MRQSFPQSRTPSSRGFSFPAPTGGWNARDPVANMPTSDAVYLDNFFPQEASVAIRPGFELFATLPADTQPGSPHDIRSILPYQSPSGTAKLFVGLQDGLYDATAGGAISVIASAATNGEWQHTNITTAGGSFLWCCNGVDKARYFNGTAWTVLDGTSTPALTGITSTDIINVSLFKSRLYLCAKNSLSLYYLPVNSVAGAAEEFPLGAIFRRGGYLVATEAWTLDGGNGPDDYLAIATSEGEVAVYQGTNPANAATWALRGVYYLGTPIGRRCFHKFNGDLVLLTVQGLFPLSRALLSATTDKRSAVSDKISQAWRAYAEQYQGLFGWQVLSYPEASLLLVNVPVVSEQADGVAYSYQFAMNTQTGAWARFTNQHSEAWGVHDGGLYFANHNKLYKAWTGQQDNGFPIDARAKTAFFSPSNRNGISRFTLMRPIVQSAQAVSLQLGVDNDYGDSGFSGAVPITYGEALALWDSAIWDQSKWAGRGNSFGSWRTVSHRPGHSLAVRLRVYAKDISMAWVSTDFIAQRGGLM